jgi:DNA processing protein
MEKSAREILKIEPGGPSWPQRLVNIDAKPEALWLRGDGKLLQKARFVAIVGSRSPTPYGLEQARLFAGTLAAAGVVVISGLARGIDSAAHIGALDAGGETIAVLGSSVDRPWPRGEVLDRVLEEGLLMSEHPLGSDPRPHHFPLRNRLISGLSDGVIVIEAAARSGSLITAHWAADQGRDVFALPGRVDQLMSRGTHKLLREGAYLVENPSEVIAELYGDPSLETNSEGSPLGATPDDDVILTRLADEDLSVDELVAATGMEVRALLSRLVEAELAGLIARAPGGLYRRVRRRR